MRKLIVVLALLVGVAVLAISTGAVDYVLEWRVKSALVDAGVTEKRATCMAARMVDRLSITQLRKLQNMQAQEGELDEPAGLADYITRVRRVGDTEVISVTGSSAAFCAFGIG